MQDGNQKFKDGDLRQQNQTNQELLQRYQQLEKLSYGFKDLFFPATGHQINPTLSKPDFDETDIGLIFRANQESADYTWIIAQLNHDWEPGTKIYPHIHWKQKEDNIPFFTIKYRVYNNGETVPYSTPSNWDTLLIRDPIFDYKSGTLAQIYTNKDGISMEGKKISCFVEIKLYRANSDSYSLSAILTQLDLHYYANSVGSKNQYEK